MPTPLPLPASQSALDWSRWQFEEFGIETCIFGLPVYNGPKVQRWVGGAMKDYSQARSSIEFQLRQAGWKIKPEALKPLGEIDFAKLVDIHDHEERFLEQTFIRSLVAMRSERASTAEDQGKITADDVETALRMLGVAAARQAEATLSKASKAAIKEACGFC